MSHPGPLHITVVPGELSLCRLPAGSPVPAWAMPFTPAARGAAPPAATVQDEPAPALVSITWTSDETSVVCASAVVPPGIRADAGWRALAVAGPLDLSLTGVLASIAQPLAEAELPLFAVSTFDTDYVLVRGTELEAAVVALRAAGHMVG